MTSKENKTSQPSFLKQPTAVLRRATMAECRSRATTQASVLSSRPSNISNKTAVPVGKRMVKPATTTTAAVKPAQDTAPKRGTKRGATNDSVQPVGKKGKVESTQAPAKKVGSKRPAWDLKGRLADMEQYIKTMGLSQRENRDRLEMLENKNSELEGNVVTKEQKIVEASALSKDLEEHISMLTKAKAEMEAMLQHQLTVERHERELAERESNELKFSLEVSTNENKSLKLKLSQLVTESLTLTTDLNATKEANRKMSEENRRQHELIESLQSTIENHVNTIASCEEKLRSEESQRRVLHNCIQELKGNIRVFCRIRPQLNSEKINETTDIEFEGDTNMNLSQKNGNETISGGKRAVAKLPFTFDKIFTPSSTQQHVFDEISQLVQSVLDGYNVCIFAYGQTGSGKTFTMEGDLKAHENWGMIPRALEQVFLTSENLKEKGWQYNIEASFLEIYNETIRDLLGSGDPNTKHDIKLVNTNTGKQSNDVIVTNLTTVSVTTSNQVSSLLTKACENRAVAATNCNERSSRSHSMFRLKLSGFNQITEEKCEGTLNLVDLAGSERLSQSGSTGLRLKETQNINKSLSNLGIVITALANKESHIPYRNSKLTYLLQNSLGGNSKSLMFVNISPLEDSFQETLSSLRFATKVNTCNIGTAQKAKKL